MSTQGSGVVSGDRDPFEVKLGETRGVKRNKRKIGTVVVEFIGGQGVGLNVELLNEG